MKQPQRWEIIVLEQLAKKERDPYVQKLRFKGVERAKQQARKVKRSA